MQPTIKSSYSEVNSLNSLNEEEISVKIGSNSKDSISSIPVSEKDSSEENEPAYDTHNDMR
jgi:hypothetical protein